MPPWIKIVVSMGGLAALFWFFDMGERLFLFFHVVLLPVVALYFLGVISEETYQAIRGRLPNPFNDLRAKIKAAVDAKKVQEIH